MGFLKRILGSTRKKPTIPRSGAEGPPEVPPETSSKPKEPIEDRAEPVSESVQGIWTTQEDELAGESALDQVLDATRELVLEHDSVLVSKRRQKVYRDDYGILIDHAWQTELDYFRANLVDEAIMERCGPKTIALAQLQLLHEATAELRDVIVSDIDRFFALRLTIYIDVLVQDMDNDSPVDDLDFEGMSPSEYEHLCADKLRSGGWTVRVCGGVGDQGVDLVADHDATRAVFQCKLYAKPVGNSAVQEVHTGRSFHDAHCAAVVSPAGFTPSARAAAEQTGVHLLHHEQLSDFNG